MYLIFFTGIGAGLCYSSHVIILGFNFYNRLNLASGIAVSGCGVGTLFFAPLMEVAREIYGNSGLFLILAGLSFHHVLFGCMFFPSKIENNRKMAHRKRIFKKDMVRGQNILFTRVIHFVRYFKALKQLAFTSLCGAMLMSATGIFLVYVHFPRYIIEKGATPFHVSMLLSVNGLCNSIARILAGLAANADNVDDLLIFFGSFGILGLTTILFPLYVSTSIGPVLFSIFLVS